MRYGFGLKLLVVLTGFSLQNPWNNFISAQDHSDKKISFDLEVIARDVTSPVALKSSPDESGRMFIVEQDGRILVLKDGQILTDPFLDISNKIDNLQSTYSEKGLLGLAFHPRYSQNGKFYVYYSARSEKGDHKSVIEEYRASPPDANTAQQQSSIIMEFVQPESNHNGGDLAFGIDGYLYISTGDGGGANDRHGEFGNGQNLQNLLGKILRIDVDGESPYAIPELNPFVGKDAREEIWAYGLRNPWRMSFDRLSAKLFTGDVGQNEYEEINIIEIGKNYGWKVMEGFHCFDPPENCDKSGLTLPIHEYPRSDGISVTGGYVYRGKAIPDLYGKYVYADWTGKLFYLENTDDEEWENSKLIYKSSSNNNIETYINSFAEDSEGELYILTQKSTGPKFKNGIIYKIIPAD